MTYTPKTEEQLAKEGLLEEGIYDFEIIDTNDAPSKAGNDMITLQLAVFDNEGGQRKLFDYISFGNNFGERKFRRAAVACGLIDVYNSGELRHYTFMGATGKIQVKQRDGTPDFPLPKNVVGDYISRETKEIIDESSSVPGRIWDSAKPKPTSEIIDDKLPFDDGIPFA